MSLNSRKIVRCLSSFLLLAGILLMNQVSWSADFQFKCPESMTTEERDEHYNEFLAYCVKEHPNWTVREVIKYRMKLLEEHNCEQTLENIRNNELEEKKGLKE